MRTRIIVLFVGVLVAVLSLAPWMFVFGWNHGVVGAIDGTHSIGYGRAILIEGVLATSGLMAALIGLMPQVFKLILLLSGRVDGRVTEAMDTVAMMRYAEQAAAMRTGGNTISVTCERHVEGALPGVCLHCGTAMEIS